MSCTSLNVLYVVQVLTPVIKPDKKAPARLYWNLVHWGLGYATAALAVANIFLGFDILVRMTQLGSIVSLPYAA